IQTVAILFCQSALHTGNIQLVIAATITPFTSLLGVYFFLWIQRLVGTTPKTMVMVLASLGALCPIYVLIGGIPGVPIGLKSTTELYIVAAYFGFLVSAISSYCRSTFAQMVPRGHENEFFAFYQITAAGSSWLGPLVTGIISDITLDMRNSFWFILIAIVLGIALMGTVDVEGGRDESVAFSLVERRNSMASRKSDEAEP
ncbi:autophagy-related protein 22-like protein, partial [Jimgerdemannia flammicorona]